jgi:ubiquitin-like modifier-activating enzyme ATG7
LLVGGPFLLLAHADLKRYHFDYHFCFPALKPSAGGPFTLVPGTGARGATEALGKEAAEAALGACDEWRRRRGTAAPAPFWLVRVAGGSAATCHPLSAWQELTTRQREEQDQQVMVMVAMADPCHLPLVPGWPLRNLLMVASARWAALPSSSPSPPLRLRVLCLRDGSSTGRASAAEGRSFVVDVSVPPHAATATAAQNDGGDNNPPPAASPTPDALGWEADASGRALPRRVDLSTHLSPLMLAEQAVALNLRLMRWRAAPRLELEPLARCRCLLLGAGTLGCALARTLLAWGVRTITFVDDGRVAYSNPVRQSLYEHSDCAAGGKPKAQAAAEALARIFPGVDARGVDMRIPMPGHGAVQVAGEGVEADSLRLDALVEEHDAVFLLTDTRESRWLPTLLAAARRKVAVTAALGFDGYLVMRHGVAQVAEGEEEEEEGGDEGEKRQQQQESLPLPPSRRSSKRVGCYFCQDVVAPSDSTRARALDQQCTVARPGLAPIAGALSAELLAALLQHPLGVEAPAEAAAEASRDEEQQDDEEQPPPPALGPVPHMIRGHLSGFSQVCMSGGAFPQCTACGPAVVRAWRARGAALVREAAADPSALERLTGLAALREEAERRLGGGEGGGRGGAAGGRGGGGGGDGEEEDDDWVDL